MRTSPRKTPSAGLGGGGDSQEVQEVIQTSPSKRRKQSPMKNATEMEDEEDASNAREEDAEGGDEGGGEEEGAAASGGGEGEKDENGNHTSSALNPPPEQPKPKGKRGRPMGGGVVGGKKNLDKSKIRPLIRKISDIEAGDVDTDLESDHDEEKDPKGEEKVNINGYLLGGREYRFQTFTLPRHPSRLYLYALDASKLLGFKDSYIFFMRNESVRRVNGTEADRALLRNRPITLVRAREIFKLFGHKVVRKGRPIRDDYFVGDLVETEAMIAAAAMEAAASALGMDEDDNLGYGIYDHFKIPGILDGGPFRRHGLSVAGFSGPDVIVMDKANHENLPEQLAKDSWMYKCAVSAAEFNSRLNKARPTSFLDLHTNIEQVAQASQPVRVMVERDVSAEGADAKNLILQTEISAPSTDPKKWKVISDSTQPFQYPLALCKNQYQDAISIYPFRFDESEGIAVMPDPKDLSAPTREIHDVPPTLMGALPYKPKAVVISTRKRGRPRKETEEDDRVCVDCNEYEPPNPVDGIPSSAHLTCSRCHTRHHPTCLDIENPILVSKCQSYAWVCSNCKVCTKCKDASQDAKLLFCDLCDRATHMFCLDPPLENLPEGVWLCPECAVCHSCKTVVDKDWHHVTLEKPYGAQGNEEEQINTFLCTYCASCNAKFEKNQACPICLVTFDPNLNDEELTMMCCDKCERWIHVGCDPALTMERYLDMSTHANSKYACILCNPIRRDRFAAGVLDRSLILCEFNGHPIFAPPMIIKD